MVFKCRDSRKSCVCWGGFGNHLKAIIV